MIKERLKVYQSKLSVNWIILAVLVIAMFPALGNALAYLFDQPRRLWQLAFFVPSLVILGVWQLNIERIRSFLKKLTKLDKIVLIVIGSSFFIRGFVGSIFAEKAISKSMLLEFCLSLAWAFLLFLWIRPVKNYEPSNKNVLDKVSPWQVQIIVLGFIMSFVGWLKGPIPGESHLDLTGNAIMLGTCALVGYFVLLFTLPKRQKIWMSLPYAYLIVLSTSRAAWLGFGVIYTIWGIRSICMQKSGDSAFRYTVLSIIAPLLAIWVIIVLPIGLETRYFPYYVQSSESELVAKHYDGLLNRFSRVTRLMPISFDHVKNLKDKWFGEDGEPLANLNSTSKETKGIEQKKVKKQKKTKKETRFERFVRYNKLKEGRWPLLRKSFELSLARPFGFWPRPFAEEAKLLCDQNKPCYYPHNSFMEISYYFGWVFAIPLVILFLWALFYLLRVLILSSDPLAIALIIGLTSHGFKMQFSGDLFDGMIAWGLGAIWVYYEAGTDQEILS